jgi:choline kinase
MILGQVDKFLLEGTADALNTFISRRRLSYMIKGVIIAAGYGSRLRKLTGKVPKALVEIAGRPIITYPIDAMLNSGITDITIVVGHKGEEITARIGKLYPSVTFTFNENYRGENATSILAARHYVESDPFVLAMGDHLISPEIIRTLLSQNEAHRTICVDASAKHESQISDATKVWVNRMGMVTRIGKGLTEWHFIDTGVFMMDQPVLMHIEQLMGSQGNNVTISDVVGYMATAGMPFSTCDVSGKFWADIDTPEDFQSLARPGMLQQIGRLTSPLRPPIN